jgi:two-component sensor histidine kinase
MVLIHESFQQSETDEFSTIEFSDFIRKVANNLYRIYVIDPSKVKLKIDAERIYLEIKQAIATGLILNELLTNSFKYAFDYNKDHNEVSVSFKILENNIIELIVSDNGKGIPYDLNTMTFNSLGLQIVKSLSEDHLDGNIELERQGGTKFIITFRKREIIIK